MNKWLLSMALSTALLAPTVSADEPYRELKNELEIFTGILQTAARQGEEQSARLEDFRYTYVRDQGVIYRTRLSTSSWRFVTPDIPEPPMPPEAPEMGEFARDLQLDVVVEQGLRSAHRILSKLSGEYSDEWFDITEQQRDLAWDIRDREREIRELEFQLRNSEGQEKTQLAQQLEQQKTELAKFRERNQALQAEAEKLKQELRAERDKIRQQRIETRDKALARAEQLLSTALCDYGITLKSLPTDESITFIVEGADNSLGERRRDRVYVFAMQDVKQCQDKADAEALIETAQPYYF